MSQTIKELKADAIIARDGRIGTVEDVYFDDERWVVRYLVVDTGGWMADKRVLISPASVLPGGSGEEVRVALTREQVKGAPDAQSDRPVSRQYEIAHADHFNTPYYWTGPFLWGAAPYPLTPGTRAALERTARNVVEHGSSHLRSGSEVIGYAIEARDGAIGEVEDFAVDEKSWAIQDVVVDTTRWWPGGQVRVHPQYVEGIDWDRRTMRLRLTREEVKRAGAETPRS